MRSLPGHPWLENGFNLVDTRNDREWFYPRREILFGQILFSV